MKKICCIMCITLSLCILSSCNDKTAKQATVPSYFGMEFEQEKLLREYRRSQKQFLSKTDDVDYVNRKLQKTYEQLFEYYNSNFHIDSSKPTNKYYSSGDFLFTDYKNGACLVKYTGNDENINIPETVNNKKVIAIGSYFEWYIETTEYYKGKYYKDAYDMPLCYSPFSFRDCQKTTVVKSIYIPKYVKYISQIAFNICGYYAYNYKVEIDTLKPINNPKKVLVSKENPYYSSKDGALYTKNMACLLYIPTWYESSTFKVPKGVLTISKHCLKYGDYADEYRFLNNEAVFEGNVKKIIIPETVTKIEDSLMLPNVEVSDKNAKYKSNKGKIANK